MVNFREAGEFGDGATMGTRVTGLNELLERVKAATGKDDPTLRYVDCHLWVISQGGDARMHVCDSSAQDFIWERGIGGLWVRSVVKFRAVPKYTASIDAALAFAERVLSGHQINLSTYGQFAEASTGAKGVNAILRAPSAPLAIIAATLTALIARKDAQ